MEYLRAIANHWQHLHPVSNEIFFGFIDFAQSLDLIRSHFKLSGAPVLFHFGPDHKLGSWDQASDINTYSDLETMADWITSRSGVHVIAFINYLHSR